MSKRNIVVDDGEYNIKHIKKNSNRSEIKMKTKNYEAEEDSVELDKLLEQQRIKEKQLLQQWKDVRNTEKKIRSIMRKQSRDIHSNEKECFKKIDGPYDIVREMENHYIWKHDGCNDKCKADNCQQWMNEYLYFDIV